MPFRAEWEDPKIFLEHNGVIVYHTYVDDDVEQGAMMFWFTLSDHDDDSSFDVRDLKSFSPDLTHDDVLRAAIESGELKDSD